MTQTFNPYAAPESRVETRESHCWRSGKVVFVPRGSDLPERCVKCNAAALAPTKTRKFYWHHPAIFLAILFNILIYIVIALIARKSVKLSPGLCAVHKRRRVVGLFIAWGGLALFLLGVFGLSGAIPPGPVLLMIAVGLIAIIPGMQLARIVYAKRIDADQAQLRGCGRPFIESLPSR